MTTPADAGQELHVVFGTAALGSAVMRCLVEQGKRVRMVSRSGRVAAPAGVEVVRGDATDPVSTREVCRGAAVVYHCASPAYTDWERLSPPIQAGIIEGAAAAGAKLVCSDNMYVYGPVPDRPMTEDLPYAATTRKGRLRITMFEQLMEAHKSGKVRVAIGRGPDFYGPVATANTIYGERVYYPALAGKRVNIMGKLENPHTFIYIDDFGRGLVTLGEHDAAMGQSWHVPSAPTLTQRQMVELIFTMAGQPAKMSEAPSIIFHALAPFVPIMRELAEMLYQWENPYVVSHAKFEQAFGPVRVTPHEEAVRRTVEWFRAHPKT